MDPRMGAFLSLDPFFGIPTMPSTLQRYQYAGAQPVSSSDPSGLLLRTPGFSPAPGLVANVARSQAMLNVPLVIDLITAAVVAAIATSLDEKSAEQLYRIRKQGRKVRGLSVFVSAADIADSTAHIQANQAARPDNGILHYLCEMTPSMAGTTDGLGLSTEVIRVGSRERSATSFRSSRQTKVAPRTTQAVLRSIQLLWAKAESREVSTMV